MKLKDLNEKYREYEVKEGFMDLLIKPSPKTVWDLEEGDKYYYVYGDGCPDLSIWHEYNYERNARNLGNVFLTKEDAEFELNRRMIYNELLRAGGRLVFKKESKNYAMCVQYNAIIISNWMFDNYGLIYFDTEGQAIEAIKTIGEDRLKKYWFVTMEE